ncbi:hypothetical protein L7F22_029823 [Adiantum nelumboides]|nr:hypothetical protein [Adiantum nelumboides]
MECPESEYIDTKWQKLDAKAKATIRLQLAESVYFTIVGERIARDVWDKLCSSYENKSATNKIFLMKKLFDLCMKEEDTISTRINKFNIIFTQLTTQGLVFDEEIKCIFLLCSLPSSWDTLCIMISNSASGSGLVYNDILGSLFIKEICRKSLEGKKDGDAYVASNRQRGHTQSRAKSKDHGGSRNKSQDSMGNVECYHYHKKGHVKKDCRKWQPSKKDKQFDDTSKSQKFDDSNKGKAKLEEINVIESPNAPTVETLPMLFLTFYCSSF